jgi:hypothetical protein
MPSGLHDLLQKAAKYPHGPRDMSRVVRQAVRYCLPGERDPFVPEVEGKKPQPKLFLVEDQDKRRLENLSLRRKELDLFPYSVSAIAVEAIRRYLSERGRDWDIDDVSETGIDGTKYKTWPPYVLVEKFLPPNVPNDLLATLEAFYVRSAAPNTLPELLRLAQAALKQANPNADPDAAAFIAEVAGVLTRNAASWELPAPPPTPSN